MAFHVRDPATDSAVRRLAKLKNKTLTATILEAVEHEYERESGEDLFIQRIKAIQAWVRARGRPGGLPADKAFYDELSGDEDLSGIP